MSLASAGANLGNSILGSATKAALLVRRMNPKDMIAAAVNDAISAAQAAIYAGDAAAGAAATAGGLMSMIGGSSGGMRGKELINFVRVNKDWDYFEFQYNPETIYLSSQVGSYMSRQGAPESGLTQITMTDVPAQTTMNFRVYFYDINNADAFLQDKLILSASALIKDVAGLVCTYSVQTPVEGLVSLVNQYATRQAIFVFGDVVFYGEIENVNAQYTMFSPGGNPIAAVVDMSIRQQTAVVKDEDGCEVSNMGFDYWDSAFTKLFGKPGVDQEVDGTSLLDAASSLVNLNA